MEHLFFAGAAVTIGDQLASIIAKEPLGHDDITEFDLLAPAGTDADHGEAARLQKRHEFGSDIGGIVTAHIDRAGERPGEASGIVPHVEREAAWIGIGWLFPI